MLGCLHVGVDVLHSVERHADDDDDDDDDDQQRSDLEKEWDDDIGGEGAKSPVGGSGLVPRITDSNVKIIRPVVYDYSCDYFDHLPGVSDPHGRKADEFSSVA